MTTDIIKYNTVLGEALTAQRGPVLACVKGMWSAGLSGKFHRTGDPRSGELSR